MSFEGIFFAKGIDPNQIIQLVHQDLDKLYEKEISLLKPGVFRIVGHKSYHLYSDLNERLTHAGFLVGFFHPFVGGGRIIQKYALVPSHVDECIAVDSINTGEEIESVLRSLSARKIKVRKIFCYVANVQGIQSLEKQGLILPGQVVSIYTFPTHNYEKFYRETLQIYYQSIIEPMDTDHPHRIYTLRGMKKDRLVKIVERCVSETIGKKDFDIDRIQAPKNMLAFSFDFVDVEGEIPKFIQDMFAPIELGVESISVRTRATHDDDIDFSIVVCCQPNVNMKTLFKNRKRICVDHIKDCYIKGTRFLGKKRRPSKHSVICPLCLSNNLSIILLNRIQEQMVKMQEEEKFEIRLDRDYVPLR